MELDTDVSKYKANPTKSFLAFMLELYLIFTPYDSFLNYFCVYVPGIEAFICCMGIESEEMSAIFKRSNAQIL